MLGLAPHETVALIEVAQLAEDGAIGGDAPMPIL